MSLLFLGVAALSFAQKESPDDVYRDLKTSTYWTHPAFAGKIDTTQFAGIAKDVRPYEFRFIAVPALGKNFTTDKKEQRMAFAKYINDKKLNFGDKGIIVVLTKKGLSAYNQKLAPTELVFQSDKASAIAKAGKYQDFTPAIKSLVKGIYDLAQTKQAVRTNRGTTGYVQTKTVNSNSSMITGFFCLAIPIALVAGVVAIMFGANKQKIKRSRQAAEDTKVKALNAMTFIDSYDGLLKMGTDADAVRQYRDRMGQNYEEGMARLRNGRTVADFDLANNTFSQVIHDFEDAKSHVNSSTSGAGVAYTIPPIIDNQRAPLFEPLQGVSYFSSEPSNALIPVEVNFGGQRKTVMVTPAERDQLLQGNMPQMRGQYNQQGQFLPWYGVQGYDPYRDYYSHSFVWDVIAISAMSSMFAPHYGYGWGGGLFGGGYGGYGYGGGTVINNYYEQNPGQNTYYNNSGGDFDTGNSGGSGNYGADSGGDFDTGSSSSDSGGSFDTGSSGGGGDFDFGSGGSDFGGGDFGGGGDSGGGGDF